MAGATIVHDTSEAVELCAAHGLYLKPITKMTISVALPQLKQPGKSISNWEVMERLKGMVPHHQFSALRIAKSTMEFIRFEGEVENRGLVGAFLAGLDGRTLKLSGFPDALRVRAAEFRPDFPTRHDWDSFFRDAEDMNETLPGERPDTVHLEGLPCRWFSRREAGGGAGGNTERPSEEVLVRVFERFGAVRHVDIPMLDPYREEMTGRSFHTFSFGGHLNFEAYVQYREYAGFVRAMGALRGMKLMHKGEDGKAVACNIKVSFDSTKHLSDASIRKRQLERQKLQELERQREEQKRREKEAEERQRAEERKQKELEELERERRREEKLRRREQRQRDRELRRSQKKLEKLQAEEQRQLQEKVRLEERRLLLAQRNLQSLRLLTELLGRAKAARLQAQERREQDLRRRRQLEERRRLQEAELRRVEEEKERALGLQRRERQLRQRLLSLLLSRKADDDADDPPAPGGGGGGGDLGVAPADLLRPVLDILQSVSAGCAAAAARLLPGAPRAAPDAEAAARSVNGGAAGAEEAEAEAEAAPGPASPERRGPAVLACIPDNHQQPRPAAPEPAPLPPRKDARPELDKCNREPGAEAARGEAGRARGEEQREERGGSRRAGSREDDGRPPRRRERRSHRKRSHPDPDGSPRRRRRSASRSQDRAGHRRRERSSRDRRASPGRKRSRHRRGQRSRSGSPRSPGPQRSAWDR